MERAGVTPQFGWRIMPETPARRDRLAKALDLEPVTAQLLLNRKIEDADAAAAYLDPSLKQVPDPSGLPDFAAAMEVLQATLDSRKPILIHGDYDVDGLSGTALLYRLFRLLDHPVSVYLPDRFRDGYSFGENSLEAIRKEGAQVVIAVDNGTTAIDAVATLRERGVTVLVVDHHQPGPVLPDCNALLNPWVRRNPDDEEFFPHFCGTAVAWLLAWGLLRHLGGDDRLPEAHRRFLLETLGLAAVATVADVMPLVGPNRALVTKGLQSLSSAAIPGLQALMETSGLRHAPNARDLGFRIGPRLNAAGRLGKTELAFRLLTTTRPEEARSLATTLEGLNEERKQIERHELELLEADAEAMRSRGDQVLFLGRSDAHFGVLGIVANRMLDSTGLPTLLWAECQPGVARGSARAPEGCDLVALLSEASEYLDEFGGHSRAAGFRFHPRHAGAIAEKLRAAASGRTSDGPADLQIDAEVHPRELTRRVVEQFERLEPFGEANPEPQFLATGLRLAGPPKPIGDGSHVSLMLESHGEAVRALGWRMADRLAPLASGAEVDVVFTPSINHFRGRHNVEWTLRDLRSRRG